MLVFKDTTFCSDIDCIYFDICAVAGNATNMKGKDKSPLPVTYASFKRNCPDYEQLRKGEKMETKEYEWQWIFLYTPAKGTPKYYMTEKFHSSAEEVAVKYHNASLIEKYEPSKREKKDEN